ncbi:YceI family protein [Pontiellaceae bacterium B12219]|nr:YceI family protein [Pontiellaceae bacterium B12219]
MRHTLESRTLLFMKTHRFARYIVLAGLSLTFAASAEIQQAEATADIRFKGSSTLHGFEGKVKTKPFLLAFISETTNSPMRVSGTASFNVLEMSTGNGKRDSKMRKMLDQEQFSTITGTLTHAELPTIGNSTASLHLRIREIEQDVPVTLSYLERVDDLVTFNVTFNVSLEAFDLKAPSVIGLIRVSDTVEIDCSVTGTLQ